MNTMMVTVALIAVVAFTCGNLFARVPDSDMLVAARSLNDLAKTKMYASLPPLKGSVSFHGSPACWRRTLFLRSDRHNPSLPAHGTELAGCNL